MTPIDKPGVYDLPAADYHADPVAGGSLSSTGARRLLPPSCPAKFQHWRENGDEPNDEFDLGTAAHKLVLGVGPELVRVEGDGKSGPEVWNTTAVKDQVAKVRAAGGVPLKPSAYEAVHAMAEKIRQHPLASALFAPGTGEPERALVWRDEQTGVWCRALVDWLRHRLMPGRRLLVPDYKTCASAAPDDAVKAIARYGYHVQGAWYLAGLRALGLADEAARFLLVMQEKTAPYLVTVIEPDHTAMRLGAMRMREALRLYAECSASGRWPGYSDDVVLAELPPWETRELEGQVW